MKPNKRQRASETASLRSQRSAIRAKAIATLDVAPFDLSADRVLNRMRKFAAAAVDKNDFYKGAAEAVIWESIRIWPGEPAFADFFEQSTGDPETAWNYSARVGSVADALFKLRGIEGFDRLCRHIIQQRSLKDAACELYAAGLFFNAGFEVCAKKRPDKTGSNFDFDATKDGCSVNVEVSCIDTSKEYTPARIAKKLKHKKSQLPADTANVIFLFVPEWWTDEIPDLSKHLERDGEAFIMTQTDRVNAIVFMNERHITWQTEPLSRGELGFEFSAMKRNSARTSADVLNALLDGTVDRSRRETPEDVAMRRLTLRLDTELYDWADRFWQEHRND